jgi:dolichyl-phosphate-mannose--protein O-mannosyl transferase
MYYFYAVALAPFLVMGAALVLGDIIGRAPAWRHAENTAAQRHLLPPPHRMLIPVSERHGTGLLIACLYVGLVIANFIWIWPIITGMPISVQTWNDQHWIPSWG